MLSGEARAALDTALNMAATEGASLWGFIFHGDDAETFTTANLSRADMACLAQKAAALAEILSDEHQIDAQDATPNRIIGSA
jgi:hypothetical protein